MDARDDISLLRDITCNMAGARSPWEREESTGQCQAGMQSVR